MLSVRNFGLLLSLFACTACGGKSSAPQDIMQGFTAGAPAPSTEAPTTEIPGPTLSGKWSSNCTPVKNGDMFVKLTYEFDGKRITRSEDDYDSASCDRLINFKVNNGNYIFTAKFANDVYEVEYNLASSDGFIKHRENLQAFASQILVSYESSGDGVSPEIALTQTKPLQVSAAQNF